MDEKKKEHKMLKEGFQTGVSAGAGIVVGYGVAVGIGYGFYKAGTFVCRKIGNVRNKRLAKKAKAEQN